jgi:hypothetical protein
LASLRLLLAWLLWWWWVAVVRKDFVEAHLVC